MHQLLRIGEFARLAGISVKTLRFYADEGLLIPAKIDSQSGYRYYTVSQVEDITRILNLRTAGVDLSSIRALTTGAADASATHQALQQRRRALTLERARVEQQLRAVDGLLAALEHQGMRGLSALRIIGVDPQFAYSERAHTDGNGVTRLFEQAEATVAAVDGRAQRSPLLILHNVGTGSEADVEVCIPIEDRALDLLPHRLVEGLSFACSLTFQGPYGQTQDWLDRMHTWLRDVGLTAAGPLREVYHRFGADQIGYQLPTQVLAQSEDGYITELQLPISSPKQTATPT